MPAGDVMTIIVPCDSTSAGRTACAAKKIGRSPTGDRPIPIGIVDGLHCTSPCAGVVGIMDEGIQLAELGEGDSDGGRDIRTLPNVAGDTHCLATPSSNLVGDDLGAIPVQRTDTTLAPAEPAASARPRPSPSDAPVTNIEYPVSMSGRPPSPGCHSTYLCRTPARDRSRSRTVANRKETVELRRSRLYDLLGLNGG